MKQEVKIDYYHNGGPFKATITIMKKGYIKGQYHLELKFTDPTDCERAFMGIVAMFSKNKVGGK